MSGEHDNSIPSFGTLLRRSRQAAGLSQEELAERAAMSAQTIGRLERGDRQWPYPATLRRLADALGLEGAARTAFLAHVPPHVRGVRGRASQHHAEHLEERLAEQAAGETSSLQAPSTPTVDGATGDTDRAAISFAGGEVRPDGESLSVRAGLPDLPIPLTPLVGREDDVARVCVLLREGARLLTLTGPGGVGKTHLGLQIAAELQAIFADGVAFVPLAPLADAGLVLPTIARVLGAREDGEHSLAEQLHHALRRRQMLLVLDNFEHVLAASAQVSGLLEGCPRVAVLATSRATLRIRGEQEYPVAPLALPPFERPVALDEAERSPAVRLFVARAQAASPAFALTATNASAVAAICGRLDGLPLALELAAPRTKLLAPSALLERLHHALPLLTGGSKDAPARQQTLRATIAWSYDQMDRAEQALFRHLSVFAGGCTLAAAQDVCARAAGAETGDSGGDSAGFAVLEGLGALLDQSLLQVRDHESEVRITMLETIREYALEQAMASSETEVLRHAHAVYYLHLAEEAEPELTGPEQGRWFDQLDRDHDNLRAALAWTVERGQTELGLRLAGALGRFWSLRAHVSEGRAWLERVLALAARSQAGQVGLGGGGAAYASALSWAGTLASRQGDYAQATPLLERAAALYREGGNALGAARTLTTLAGMTFDQGDHARSLMVFEEALALARLSGDAGEIARTLGNLGEACYFEGHLEQAAQRYAEALTLARQEDRMEVVATQLANLANVARRRGDLAQATTLARQALELNRALGNRKWVIKSLEHVAMIAAAAGLGERAARLLGAAEALHATSGLILPPPERDDIEQAVGAVRAALGEERWQAANAGGRRLSLEESIAEALGEVLGEESARTAG